MEKGATKKEWKIELQLPGMIGLVIGIIVVVAVVNLLIGILRGNPYGEETRIDNFGEYYSGVEQDEKDLIFYQLHSVIAENVGEGVEVPKNGALVREGTVEYEYNEDAAVYYGKFVVDIAEVEQSYRVQFEWSPVGNGQNLGGYPVLVSCLPKSLRIYEGDKCVDMATRTVTWENEYQIDYTYGTQTSYRVRELLQEYMMVAVELDGYKAVVDEPSLARMTGQAGVAYKFRVGVSDIYEADGAGDGSSGGGGASGAGVTWLDVMVRTDEMYGEKYIAMYVTDGDTRAGYVLTNDAGLQGELGQWILAAAGVDEMEIKYEKL